MTEIVKVHCLKHTYVDQTVVDICGLDFIVNQGEKVAILGPNGCGKTTLLKHILGMLRPQEGLVEVFGNDPAKGFDQIREKIGVVLQDVEEQIIGPTVYDDILFAPLNYGYNLKEATFKADNIIEKLGIKHLVGRIPHYLSGGEKKKVALAGAMVLEPELLIMDEPFSNLDIKSQDELIEIIHLFGSDFNSTFIISLHDINLVEKIADTLYLMGQGGQLSQKGKPKEILANDALLVKYNLKRAGS